VLGADLMAALDALINQRTVLGARYDPQGTADVDTEDFAPA
jgi:hypothetical protein